MSVAVFGSINMDMVVYAATTPSAGQTVTGKSFHTCPGGKGVTGRVKYHQHGRIQNQPVNFPFSYVILS